MSIFIFSSMLTFFHKRFFAVTKMDSFQQITDKLFLKPENIPQEFREGPLADARKKLVVGMFNFPYAYEDRFTSRGMIENVITTGNLFRSPLERQRFFNFFTWKPEYGYILFLAVQANVIDINTILTNQEFNMGTTVLAPVARSGYVDAVEELLELGADVNGAPGATSPLVHAIRNNHQGIVELLLKNGADPNYKTPMSWAVCSNNPNLVYLLTMYGANSNEIDPQIVASHTRDIGVFIEFLDNTQYSPFRGPEEGLVFWIVRFYKSTRNDFLLLMLRELIKRGATSDLALQHKALFDTMAALTVPE